MGYDKKLTPEEWAKHYNLSLLDDLVRNIRRKQYTIQTQEMLKITKPGEKILEIGCGSGETSLALAQEGRICTAVDNSPEPLKLLAQASKILNIQLQMKLVDATKPMPFEENSFDIAFQAGLLEHFQKDERIALTRLWSKIAKRVISLIPNAASIAYRYGKALMEKNGTWTYGLEMPQYSLIKEFNEAGLLVEDEYTIGEMHALNFLPGDHPLRHILHFIYEQGLLGDNAGQGYLLVTVGKHPQ